MTIFRLLATLALSALAICPALAEVVKVEITERTAFAAGHAFDATGAYEKFRGRAFFALDPSNPANRPIVDLDKAPRDPSGRVIFDSEFVLLRPTDPARGNGSLIYDVNNRGGIAIMGQINGRSPANNDPTSLADAGTGFLFNHGFSLLFSAWTFDVEKPGNADRPLIMDTPVAREKNGPITGKVAYEFLVSSKSDTARFTGEKGTAYPISDDGAKFAQLTWRDAPDGKRRNIARGLWNFVPRGADNPSVEIFLAGGFEPGRIYELVYKAKDPRVTGLGLAGIRDLLSYIRTHDLESAPPPKHTLIFGISQSGRVIQTMLVQGLHVDEAGRPVFDGAFVHVAGAGKGGFNHRFAMPTRHATMLEDHIYLSDYFPFASTASHDPITGVSASTLDKARAAGRLPKIFYVNGSWEYWGRSASLITTTPDGKSDLAIDPAVRIFFLAGAQHYVGRSRERGIFSNCNNRLNHYVAMRALLMDLFDWVSSDTAPPDSTYPTIAQGTLISTSDYLNRLPKIPGLGTPRDNLKPEALDHGPRFAVSGIMDFVPPRLGKTYTTLVPAPDADGLDRAGVRMIETEVPLGTHLGWNTRRADAGFGWAIAKFEGSFIPFARTEAERAANDDPRPSIAARYRDRQDFMDKTRIAIRAAIAARFFLPEDSERILAQRAAFYDRLMAHAPEDQSCVYLMDE